MGKNNAIITLNNGLGDKFLDLIGFYVLCKNLNYNPNVIFNNNKKFVWGNNNYDTRLFNLQGITIANNNTKGDYYVDSPNPSSSLSPYKVYKFIKRINNNISFKKISNDFVVYSKKIIKPSDIILTNIPKDIENAYGIHLRKSDKVNNNGDIRHENTIKEFEILTFKLLEDVENIIINEIDVKFLIVSDDDIWKKEISDVILNMSNKYNKKIKLINIVYNNKDNYSQYNSVLDMFCLSKCKEILQGVKYSTFSILASLLGNNKLRNYSNYLDSYNICLIHTWFSVINDKKFNRENIKKISYEINNINTNINKIFT
jgi:hypothetical protein